MNQGFLAYAFTHFAYRVEPGDWCLIQAAAGGIGLLLCQMVKIREGHVIGVTSSEEKAKYVRDAGADEVIISKQADIAKEARRVTEGRGVNVVYDGVGKDTFEANLDSLALGGYPRYVQQFVTWIRQGRLPSELIAHIRWQMPLRPMLYSKSGRSAGDCYSFHNRKA